MKIFLVILAALTVGGLLFGCASAAPGSSEPAMDVSSRDSSSEVIDAVAVENPDGIAGMTDEFALEMRDKTNQLVVDTLGLSGDNIKVIPKNQCTMIVLSDDCVVFYTSVAQKGDTYLSEATWALENEEWTAMSLKVNDIFMFDN